MAQSFSKFSDLEEHFMVFMAFMKRREEIEKAWDEDVADEVWSMLRTSWTQEQIDEWEEFHNILLRVWKWRTYQVCRFILTGEATDIVFPTAPPEVNFKDVKKAGFNKMKTFAIGMYAKWLSSQPVKRDDEDDIVFVSKNTQHNLVSGYVCKEAIDIPKFPCDDIIKELERQDQTVLNITNNIGRSRSR
tara:strand:- start:30 stop:596 length:567 start_codon:yes stop_codon:yes gene_type:complete